MTDEIEMEINGSWLTKLAKVGALANLLTDGYVAPVVIAGEWPKFVVQGVPKFDEQSRLSAIGAAVFNARRLTNANHFVVVLDIWISGDPVSSADLPKHLAIHPRPADDPEAKDAVLVVEVKDGEIQEASTMEYGRNDDGEVLPRDSRWKDGTGVFVGLMQEMLEKLSRMDMEDPATAEGVQIMYGQFPEIDDLASMQLGENHYEDT